MYIHIAVAAGTTSIFIAIIAYIFWREQVAWNAQRHAEQAKRDNPFETYPPPLHKTTNLYLCVPVFPAGAFICENCGKRSHFDVVQLEAVHHVDSDRLAAAGWHDSTSPVRIPRIVTCQYCRSEYATYFAEGSTLEAD